MQGLTTKLKKLCESLDFRAKWAYVYSMLKPITVEFRQAEIKVKKANGSILRVFPTHELQDEAPTHAQWKKVLDRCFPQGFEILSIRDWGIQSATR